MKARGVVRITPADVGARVSVRSRIPAGPGEPTMTDTVGVLLAWTGGTLHIRRRDGTIGAIDVSALIAARTISAEVPSPRRKRG